jgi:predicted metalloendopeptidase
MNAPILRAALLAALLAPLPAHAAQVSGVDRSAIDPAVRPQDDLFRNANGAWLARFDIPADKSRFGSFDVLRDKAEADIRAIIDRVATDPQRKPGSEAQKVGDLYAAFMDEARAEALGVTPIAKDLKAIDKVKDLKGFAKALGEVERGGARGLFGGFVGQDAKQSDRYTVYLFQGAIGLPDRDYYFEDKFKEKREAYQAHLERMFTLAGFADPKASAANVYALEERIAKGHWSRIDSRDDEKTYNKHDRAQLRALMPSFDWDAYLKAGKAAMVTDAIVAQPSAFQTIDLALKEVPLGTWKDWLKWQVVNAAAPLLSKAFVDENFAFYGTTLRGIPQNRPRWKRGVGMVEGSMGEALGKIYVEKHFPPEAKARMETLVANLVAAYRQSISEIDWMSAETKTKAHQKLAKFTPKIGYTEKWRDYAKLEIRPGDLVGNVRRATAFEVDRQLAKLGKPIDRTEWLMSPQTVNAYYNPPANEIVFPAAILQPPFFNLAAEDAVNYGAIGAVIGHEIGHGFDDQGSKYDGDGNLKSWWTEEDRKAFESRAGKLIAQYDAFEPLPGHRIKGALTIGENIGDLSGLQIAYRAYKMSLGGKPSPEIDGLTGDQRFFYGWAQVWATKFREPALIQYLATDPHSPGEYRCNIVRNFPEFHAAFGVKEGDELYLPPEQRVKIW